MNTTFQSLLRTATAALLLSGAAWAKLPAPSDDAKAKAAEAAAKIAHGNKLADFQLCKSTDRVAASYQTSAKQAGKTVQPTATPPCADPGPFVYAPPVAAPAAAVASASAAAGVKPIEAAGAHSPAATAAAPPSTMAPAANVQAPKK